MLWIHFFFVYFEKNMNSNIRMKYSEIIRLFLARKDDLFKPVKTFYDGEEYFVYALGTNDSFIPEMTLDITEDEKDACELYDFLRTLALMVFDIGDLYFDFKVIILANCILLEDLELSYGMLSESTQDISSIGNFG